MELNFNTVFDPVAENLIIDIEKRKSDLSFKLDALKDSIKAANQSNSGNEHWTDEQIHLATEEMDLWVGIDETTEEMKAIAELRIIYAFKSLDN